MGDVPRPAPTPDSLPDPGKGKLEFSKKDGKLKWDKVDMNAEIRTGNDTCFGMYPQYHRTVIS